MFRRNIGMRKMVFAPLLVATALILAACGGGGNGAGENTLGTPGAGVETAVTEVAETTAEVPATGQTQVATETIAATEAVATEPAATETTAATEAATSVAGEGDSAGSQTLEGAYPNTLTELSSYSVVSQDCEPVMDVDGLVVSRSDGLILYVVGTPTGDTLQADGRVLIPWNALEVYTTADAVNPDTTACDAFRSNQAFRLSVENDLVANAPVVTADEDLNDSFAVQRWDDSFLRYWTRSGVEVWKATVNAPAAQGDSLGEVVFVSDETPVTFTATGVENAQISHFIIDPMNALVTHVVLQVNDQFVPVPWEVFTWQRGTDGGLALSLTDEQAAMFEGAPSFASLDEFPDTSVAGWSDELNTYWIPEE
jgi:hypothetical protein